jgi:hypothetical protein
LGSNSSIISDIDPTNPRIQKSGGKELQVDDAEMVLKSLNSISDSMIVNKDEEVTPSIKVTLPDFPPKSPITGQSMKESGSSCQMTSS